MHKMKVVFKSGFIEAVRDFLKKPSLEKAGVVRKICYEDGWFLAYGSKSKKSPIVMCPQTTMRTIWNRETRNSSTSVICSNCPLYATDEKRAAKKLWGYTSYHGGRLCAAHHFLRRTRIASQTMYAMMILAAVDGDPSSFGEFTIDSNILAAYEKFEDERR